MPRWNRKTTAHFLDALRCGGSVAKAAQASGLSRMAAYRRRARDHRFAGKWDAARAHAETIRIANLARTPVRSLALDGTLTERASTGEIYDRIDRKSNTALLALLRRLDRLAPLPLPASAAPATPQFRVVSTHQSRHSL